MFNRAHLVVLGCTSGADLALIDAAITTTAIGVDINPAYVEEARLRLADAPGVTVIEADVLDVELPGAAFDLIHVGLLMECVEPERLLRRVARWLAPAGVCSVLTQEASPELPAVSRTPYQDVFNVPC